MDLLYKLIKKKYSVEEAINKLKSEKYLNSHSFIRKITEAASTISPNDYYLKAYTKEQSEIGKEVTYNQLNIKDIKNQYDEFCTHLFKIREINDFSLIEYLKTHNAYNESDIKLIIVHLHNFNKEKHYKEIRVCLKDILVYLKLENESSNTNNKKGKPELVNQSIIFDKPETIIKLHNELKGCFPNKEDELLKVLQGEQLTEFLLFPHNGSSFVELFKRVRYNGFILNTPTEIKDWICKNFNFIKKQGKIKSVENFKENTVWDVLTKANCEPPKKNRICDSEWLPFIPQVKRKREEKEEKF